MSSKTSHRRWASVGAGSTSTTVRRSGMVTQTSEPHIYATSWNSVRWSKLRTNESGENRKSHGSRFYTSLASSVAKDYAHHTSYPTSHQRHFGSQPRFTNNMEFRSSNPSVKERSAKFRDSLTSTMSNQLTSRTSSRPSWLSDASSSHRSTIYSSSLRNSSENAFASSSKWTPSSASTSRTNQSSVRNTSSTPLTSFREKALSIDAPQMIKSSSNSSYNTLKTERPWRQRMADSARLRNVQGNEASETMHSTLTAARVRRNNISSQRNGRSNSGDDLRNSINALKNLIDDRTTGLFRRNNRLPSRESSSTFSDKYSVKNLLSSTNQYVPMRDLYSSRMNALEFAGCISRSYSPTRFRQNTYSLLSKYNSFSTDLIAKPLCFSEQSNTNNLYEYAKEFVLSKLPLNSHTSENSRGRESSRRLLSSRERTMRHHSRNQMLADSDSSSGNEERTGSRERPLRRRMRKKLKDEEKLREKLPPPTTLGIEKIDADFGKKKKEIEEEEEDRMKNLHMEYSQVLDNSETSSSMAILTTLCSSEEEESKPTKSEKGKENSLSITNSNVRKKFDLSEYLSTRKESTFWRDI